MLPKVGQKIRLGLLNKHLGVLIPSNMLPKYYQNVIKCYQMLPALPPVKKTSLPFEKNKTEDTIIHIMS